MVVDIPELLANIGHKSLRAVLDRASRLRPHPTTRKEELLLLVFGDQNVLSRADYEAGERELKPLLYSPATAEEALDPEHIKNAEFYLGLWDIPHANRDSGAQYPTVQDGEVTYAETALACILYHPRFGDAYREDGVLMMVHPEQGEYMPVNAEMILGYGYRGGSHDQEDSLRNPMEHVATYAPQLLKRGFIRNGDFATYSGSRSSDRFRSARRREFPQQTTVMFDGVRYYLGREFVGKTGTIYKLSDRYGGVAVVGEDGKEQLTHIFDIADSSNPRLKKRYDRITDAGASLTNIRPYDPSAFPDGADEASFADVITFTDELSTEAGVNISQLDYVTQTWATHAVNSALLRSRRADVINQAKEYGLPFAQAFLSVQIDQSMGKVVLDIADHQSPETYAVFFTYAQIVEATLRGLENFDIPREDMPHVVDGVLQRGKELLVAAQEVIARGEHAPITLTHVIRTMESYVSFLKQNLDITPMHMDMHDVHGAALKAVVDTHVEIAWQNQIRAQRENRELTQVARVTEQFYGSYVEMNSDASETTGDTETERARLSAFLEHVSGNVLDAGCGDGQRITEQMANSRSDLQFTAVDLSAPEQRSHDNVRYIRQDLTVLDGVENDQFDAAYSTWSVVNDVLRREDQLKMFTRLSEVLKEGAQLYIDVPWLEGGEGSWQSAAEDFQEVHADEGLPMGMIEATFGTADGGQLMKKFAIYPLHELIDLLHKAGFVVENGDAQENFAAVRSGQHVDGDDPRQSPAWRTRGEVSKPRITLIARNTKQTDPHARLLLGAK